MMSLVMPSPSHSSTGSLPVTGDSPAQLSSSAKKRKRDDANGSQPPLLFPLDDKLTSTSFETGAMLASGMFDVQALRSVDAWLNDVSKQPVSSATGNEDMVKTASDILRSFVEHKLSSSSSSVILGIDKSLDAKAGSAQSESPDADQLMRQVPTPNKNGDVEKMPTAGSASGTPADCNECGKTFKCKTDLLRHIDNEHSVVAKIFKCDECPYETRHQSNLSVHRRTHTGERPYFCGACGQSYTQGHQLKTHIRSRHGANMAYYNMDKHGMGRGPSKSFDLKIGLPSHGKNDKINQLLAAAAASGRNHTSSTSAPSQMPTFPPRLGTTSADIPPPFLGMIPSHIGPLRPFLDSNLAMSSNLLGSGANMFSHFFPFNTPPALIPLSDLPTQKSSLEPLSSLFSAAVVNGLGSSANVTTFAEAKATTPKFQPIVLETKSASHSADIANTSVQAEGTNEVTDLTMLNGEDDEGLQYEKDHCATHYLEDDHSPSAKPEDLSVLPAEPQASEYDKEDESENCNSHVSEDGLDTCIFVEPQDVSMSAEPVVCQHRQQLMRLRQNVMRMLNVLAPNIGLDKVVDLNTNQIDELLHEVLFGNLEEAGTK